MSKRIVLCADDYGQAPGVAQGVLNLVKDGRLSAVSCLVTAPYWSEHAQLLMPYQSQIDIGLHFDLTSKTPLSRLMLKAILRQLNQPDIETALNNQIDAFVTAMGCLPDFIDGHQHVHQFPVIREALLNVYEQRFKQRQAYIRVINSRWGGIKQLMIRAMGTRALIKQLIDRGIPYNQSFSGIYSFIKSSQYDVIFPSFLKEIGDRGLIMCHPGLPSSDPHDPIASARYFEYQYLSSLKFKMDCDRYGIIIERLNCSDNLLQ